MPYIEILRILTSKAVLLTYAFIGYLAVAERALPACVVDAIPAYSTNELAYPSAQTHPVAMAEHVRPVKQLPIFDPIETYYFDLWLTLSSSRIAVYMARPPTVAKTIVCYSNPRAPPSRIS